MNHTFLRYIALLPGSNKNTVGHESHDDHMITIHKLCINNKFNHIDRYF